MGRRRVGAAAQVGGGIDIAVNEPAASEPQPAAGASGGQRRTGMRPVRRGGWRGTLYTWTLGLPGQLAARVTRAGWMYGALIAVLGGMYLMLESRHAEPIVTNWPVLLMYVMIGLGLAGWLLGWRAIRGFTVTRSLPLRAFAGENCAVRLKVTAERTRFPAAALRLDDTVQHRAGLWNVFFTGLTPDGASEATYRFRPIKRGVYQFGPILANSDYPLGLIRQFRRIDRSDELLVYPALGAVLNWPFAASDRRWLGEWERVATRAPEDFRSLREYSPGDPLRTIHWRTSARMNQLMVKDYEHQSRPPLTVILDTATGLMTMGSRHLENGLSFVATLALECQRRQRLFHFCAFAPEPTVLTVRPGPGSLTACLDTLARLTPNNQQPLDALAQHIPSGMLINGDVLILTLGGVRKGFDLGLFQGRHASVKVVALGEEEFRQYFTRQLPGGAGLETLETAEGEDRESSKAAG